MKTYTYHDHLSHPGYGWIEPIMDADCPLIDAQTAREIVALLNSQSVPVEQPKPSPFVLNNLQRRWLKDALRDAYNSGYAHARDNRAVPGDNAPGYRGRELERTIGEEAARNIERAAVSPW